MKEPIYHIIIGMFLMLGLQIFAVLFIAGFFRLNSPSTKVTENHNLIQSTPKGGIGTMLLVLLLVCPLMASDDSTLEHYQKIGDWKLNDTGTWHQNITGICIETRSTNWVAVSEEVPICNIKDCIKEHLKTVREVGTISLTKSIQFDYEGDTYTFPVKTIVEQEPSLNRNTLVKIELHPKIQIYNGWSGTNSMFMQ